MITNRTLKTLISLFLLTSFTCFAAEKEDSVKLLINNIEYTLEKSVLTKIPALNALYQTAKDKDEEGKFSLSCKIDQKILTILFGLLKLTTDTERTNKIADLFNDATNEIDRIYEFKTFINQLYNLKIDMTIITLIIKHFITLILTTIPYHEALKICTQYFEHPDINKLFRELFALRYKHAPIIMEQVVSYTSQTVQIEDNQDSQNSFGHIIIMINTQRTASTLQHNVAKTIAGSCSSIEIYEAIYAQNKSDVQLPEVTDINFREEQIKIYPHIQVVKKDDNSLVAYYHDEAPTGLIDSIILNCGF